MTEAEHIKPEVLPAKTEGFAKPVTQKDAQEIFRFLFASDNSLIEMLQRDVIVRLADLIDLNHKLGEKLARNNVKIMTFRAMIRFEDGQAREFGEWKKFSEEDWGVSKVIDSISATWRFMLAEPDEEEKSHIHSLNLLISSSIKPINVMHAMFSKRIEDLESLDIMAMPMTCRIDFQDHVISQEMLALVSEWNKALAQPQHVFPFMQWCKRKSNTLCYLIRCSVPVFAAVAAYAYFAHLSAGFDASDALTAGQMAITVRWLAMSVAFIFIACRFASFLAHAVERSLGGFGRFQAIEITKGDQNRQTKLMAKNSRSFWKFIASGAVAVAWNIVGGVVTAIMLKKVQQ